MIQEKVGQVTIGDSIGHFFKGYFDFKGRTTRTGFWWAFLMIVVLMIAAMMIGVKIDPANGLDIGFGTFIIFFGFPLITVQVRRLRDAGFSGKGIWLLFGINILFAFIPGSIGDKISRAMSYVFIAFAAYPTDRLMAKANAKKAIFVRQHTSVNLDDVQD